jgi:hypothetical protein
MTTVIDQLAADLTAVRFYRQFDYDQLTALVATHPGQPVFAAMLRMHLVDWVIANQGAGA